MPYTRGMGRPPLGAAARVHTASTKITAAEKDRLAQTYGSVGKGVRAALDHLWTEVGVEPVRSERQGVFVGPDHLMDEMAVARAHLQDTARIPGALEVAVAGMHPQALDGLSRGKVEIPDALLADAAHAAAVADSNPVAYLSDDVITEHGRIMPRVDAAPPHRHRRGAAISQRYEQGKRIEQYLCATVGCSEVLDG